MSDASVGGTDWLDQQRDLVYEPYREITVQRRLEITYRKMPVFQSLTPPGTPVPPPFTSPFVPGTPGTQ